MQSIVSYVFAFFTVTVAGCLQPVNWESCSKINEWLIPDVIEGYELLSGKKKAYDNEKRYLNSLKD